MPETRLAFDLFKHFRGCWYAPFRNHRAPANGPLSSAKTRLDEFQVVTQRVVLLRRPSASITPEDRRRRDLPAILILALVK
jgi:hypothetical protein